MDAGTRAMQGAIAGSFSVNLVSLKANLPMFVKYE